MDKFKISIDEIVELTGEKRQLIYVAIRKGDLDTFLVGRRRFARPDAVKRWVDFLESRSKAGKPVSYQSRNPAHESERGEHPSLSAST